MKRIIAFLLSAVMFFSITACGQNDTTDAPVTSGIVEELTMGKGLSIHYFGGSTLVDDIYVWIKKQYCKRLIGL